MNKRNKWAILLTAGLLVMLTIAACTQNKNNTATETEQTEISTDELKALAEALPKYNQVCSFHDGLAAVCDKDTELWGFIDKTGKEVIPCQYQYIPEEFNDGVAVVFTKNERQFIIDKEGKEVASFDYMYNGDGFHDGLIAFVKVNEMDEDGEIDWMHFGKVGYMDTTGKEVIPADKYDCMMGEGPIIPDFSDGLCRQFDPENNKAFFIDKTGKVVFECAGGANDFHEGLAAVGKDISDNEEEYMWRVGFVDKTGFEVIPFTFNRVGNFSEDLCWAESDSHCGFINKSGKFEITGDWKTLILFEDTEGEDPLFPAFCEGLAWVCNQDGKFGYIDTTGKVVVPFRYEPGFNEECEWFDQQPTFDFHQGIARVWDKASGLYGFIDQEGNEVFPCQFDEAEDVSEGIALVKKGEQYGFIDTKGNNTFDLAK